MENQTIQKNAFDVAVELVNLHHKLEGLKAEEISEIFARYYSIARTLEIKGKSTSESKVLLNFIPEEIKKNMK